MKYLITCLIFSVCFTSCAALFSSPMHAVHVESEPSGANVYIDGHPSGQTPAVVLVTNHVPHMLEVKLDGYASQTMPLTASIAAGYLVLDILFGLIPVIVDAATGSWNTQDVSLVNILLERK